LWIYTINKGISTESYNHHQLTSALSAHTSNFNVITTLGENNSMCIVFSASCLKKNKKILFNIFEEIIFTAKF
jgi:hypothetical protein